MAAQAQFTVEQALSAPFSNQLTAAPAGARVAWFTDQDGRRNVWVAGSHEAARQVTHNTKDDGQDIDDITWSRDGERIAWTRGIGATGGDHTLPANPAELSGRITQHIEWVDLRDGIVHTGPEGHTPTFSGNGERLLFLRRGAIWSTNAQGSVGSGTHPNSIQSDSSSRSIAHSGASSPGAAEAESASELTAGAAAAGSIDSPAMTIPGDRSAQQLLFVRGSAHNLRLSPDGTQLAFVSERGDHSFVGVYTFATKALTWMDPGTGLDHDPVWSADGKAIAFIREVPIVSSIADRWMREGDPWSIRIATVATSTGRELWHADKGPGSLFHGVSAKDQLLWMTSGALVFPWEKTGWTQLYSVAVTGGPAAPVSYGASHGERAAGEGWEVDGVASDGRHLVWSSNRNDPAHPADIDRRHLWRPQAEAGTSTPEQMTTGVAIETSPALLSDGGVAFLQGSADRSLQPALLNDPMHRDLNSLAPSLAASVLPDSRGSNSASGMVAPEPVQFAAADGMQVHGQLFLPPACKPTAGAHQDQCAHLPAVVFFHGGSRRQMLLGFHPMQYYAQAYEFNQYLASRGFVVLSVNYRSGTGYGLNFRQALNYGANGGSEDNDVIGAAKYLQSRPEVDRSRIGAWGGSYGGYLTALALARHSDLYAAGVDLHGVHDWALELDLQKPTDEPGVDQAAIARRAFASSPMASLDTWKSPVLLIQGDDDRNVLFSQTVRLAAELKRRGVPVEELVFPDDVHDFLLHRNWITAYKRAAEFLERNLHAR